MAGKVGRPSVNEAVHKRRTKGLAWDARALANVQIERLISRLESNALGEYEQRGPGIPKILREVLAIVGLDYADCDARACKAMFEAVEAGMARLSMDTAAVKSAEIVLKKVLPDLAQIEQKNTTNNLHVVMMPAQASSSASWADQNRIVHEQRALEPATRPTDGATVLPRS